MRLDNNGRIEQGALLRAKEQADGSFGTRDAGIWIRQQLTEIRGSFRRRDRLERFGRPNPHGRRFIRGRGCQRQDCAAL